MYRGTPATVQDLELVSRHLGRPVRDVDSIAARAPNGNPLVIATLPRLSDGTPFPTTFYLTDPTIRSAVSRLEATGVMTEMNQMLRSSPKLREHYRRTHKLYLAARAEIARKHSIAEVVEIRGVTAGGMPSRVKCLHALVAQSLAMGGGNNIFGDQALRMVADFNRININGKEAVIVGSDE